ncbi:hypothetical protein HDV00_000077 [Rhizophlyctis rosea]|nr:hypothetical protein HDV00_000077 [Rhizophlyctis rosea]
MKQPFRKKDRQSSTAENTEKADQSPLPREIADLEERLAKSGYSEATKSALRSIEWSLHKQRLNAPNPTIGHTLTADTLHSELSTLLKHYLGVSTFPIAISYVWGETRPYSLAGTEVPMSDDPPRNAVIEQLLSSTNAWLDVLQMKGLEGAELEAAMRNMRTTYAESVTFVVHSSDEHLFHYQMGRADKGTWGFEKVAWLGKKYLETKHASRIWTFQEVVLPGIVIHVVPSKEESAITSIVRGIRVYARAVRAMKDAVEEGNTIRIDRASNPNGYLDSMEKSWREWKQAGWFTGPKTAWAVHNGSAIASAPLSLPLDTLFNFVGSPEVSQRDCTKVHDRIYGLAGVVGYGEFLGYSCTLEELLENFLTAVGGDLRIPLSNQGSAFLGVGVDSKKFVTCIADSIYNPPKRVETVSGLVGTMAIEYHVLGAGGGRWRVTNGSVTVTTTVWRECDLARAGLEYLDYYPFLNQAQVTNWRHDGGLHRGFWADENREKVRGAQIEYRCECDTCNCGRDPNVVVLGCMAYRVKVTDGRARLGSRLPFHGQLPKSIGISGEEVIIDGIETGTCDDLRKC